MGSSATNKLVQAPSALHQSLYRIAELASAGSELPHALSNIHAVLREHLDARNFYMVRLDKDRKHFRFLYYADDADRGAPPMDAPLALKAHENMVTVALLGYGRALFGTPEFVTSELGINPNKAPGTAPKSWLGVPMLGGDGVEGALVLQNYERHEAYGSAERDLMMFVAQLLQSALERRSMQEMLEHRVEERTQALRAEVAEREHAVRLQQALFRIAELAASPIGMRVFYEALHAIVSELLNAKNFFVVMLDGSGDGLYFPYQVDETGDIYSPRKLRRGLSEYVLRLGKPMLLHADDILALVAQGQVEQIGTPSVCWLGVPLRMSANIVGALVVQSYTEGVDYSTADQALLSFVSVHIASALERVQAQEQLRHSHDELEGTLLRLRETQTDLVEAEKMAALGQLVAGVAHEVNTPIGIAITASTGLVQRLDLSRAELNAGRLTRSSIEEFFAYADEAARLVERNLRRAAELIRTFKQVAVDRSADDRRQFELGAFLDELLPSLRLLWKQRPVQFELDCRSPIRFDSYPGALGQIITNFVQNALVHAFKERNGGKMRLSAELGQSGRVFLQFSDDGNGIGDEHLSHIFEPFYTTGRGEGCTGLGLHIVYNLVTEKLGGRIRVDSTLGQGTLFSLDLPLQAPVTAG